MSKLKMPATPYPAIKVRGDIHLEATAWDYPYRDWLINCAYEPGHPPALEVFLDKETAIGGSHFELDLRLPARKTAEIKSSNFGVQEFGMIKTKNNQRVTA